jgi:Domain of unknown function (DUF3850)
MEIHQLKSDPGPFKAVANGFKTFEIRRDDRCFVVGDVLMLRETQYSAAEMHPKDGSNPKPLAYTGNAVLAEITYKVMLRQYVSEAPADVAVLGIKLLKVCNYN